jgi:hypothetical protein
MSINKNQTCTNPMRHPRSGSLGPYCMPVRSITKYTQSQTSLTRKVDGSCLSTKLCRGLERLPSSSLTATTPFHCFKHPLLLLPSSDSGAGEHIPSGNAP